MNLKKSSCVALFLAMLSTFCFEINAQVMQRPRIVPTTTVNQPPPTSETQPANLTRPISTSRPVLTNDIRITDLNNQAPLVKKTAASMPVNSAAKAAVSSARAAFNQKLTLAMDSKLGIPYLYGSTGPNRYDCSGIVWTVFQMAGIDFQRSSASNYWREFEPAHGDERFKFGTLVFFNNLGHVGIVVNEKGFYHASRTKGVTYSSFEGYWGKRIVGFRKIPMLAD
jgi:cell wall-associated NlpC family hydrolase